MNRIWPAKIAVTIVAAFVSIWIHFASDAQFDALLAPATRDAIQVVPFVLWAAVIIRLGMIGRNRHAAIHPDGRA